jgi:hypothetical protein
MALILGVVFRLALRSPPDGDPDGAADSPIVLVFTTALLFDSLG